MKNMNKLLVVFVVSILVLVTGCSGDKAEDNESSSSKKPSDSASSNNLDYGDYTADDPLVIKLAHGDQNTDPNISNKQSVAVMFKDYVEKYSGGAIKVDLKTAASGGERQILEQTQMGILDMSIMSDGPLTGYFNPIEAIYIPYLFNNDVIA